MGCNRRIQYLEVHHHKSNSGLTVGNVMLNNFIEELRDIFNSDKSLDSVLRSIRRFVRRPLDNEIQEIPFVTALELGYSPFQTIKKNVYLPSKSDCSEFHHDFITFLKLLSHNP